MAQTDPPVVDAPHERRTMRGRHMLTALRRVLVEGMTQMDTCPCTGATGKPAAPSTQESMFGGESVCVFGGDVCV